MMEVQSSTGRVEEDMTRNWGYLERPGYKGEVMIYYYTH